jgi:hypothetical protein
MTSPQCDPVMLIHELMISIDKQGMKDCRIRGARLAVQELFEFVQRDKYADLVASCVDRFLKMVSTTAHSDRRSRVLNRRHKADGANGGPDDDVYPV